MTQTPDTVTLFGGKQAAGYSKSGQFTASRGLEEYIVYQLSSVPLNTTLNFQLNNPFPVLVIALRVGLVDTAIINWTLFNSLGGVLYTGLSDKTVYLPVGVPIPENARFQLNSNKAIPEGRIIVRRIAAQFQLVTGAL
jgi:hypothetical protein